MNRRDIFPRHVPLFRGVVLGFECGPTISVGNCSPKPLHSRRACIYFQPDDGHRILHYQADGHSHQAPIRAALFLLQSRCGIPSDLLPLEVKVFNRQGKPVVFVPLHDGNRVTGHGKAVWNEGEEVTLPILIALFNGYLSWLFLNGKVTIGAVGAQLI